MSSYPFDIGDLMRITGIFADAFGGFIDPAAVNVTITTPAGVVTTKVYLVDIDLIRDSAGHYHVDISLTAAGVWTYRWFSTGVGQGAATCTFVVEPTVKTGCLGRYATASQYAKFAGIDLTVENGPTIDAFLEIAAGDIHAVLGAIGACECAWQSWVPNFLAKINIIDAIVMYNAPCGGLKVTEQWRDRMMAMINKTFDQILGAEIELCSGYTGATVPYGDYIQQSLTEWTEAEIIYDTILRTP